ncbi:MAG: hypothetical protein WBS24_06605 [Terriglobales bacterium]
MATKRWFQLLLLVTLIAALAGCGGSTFNVQNPPGPPSSNVTVTVQATGLTNGSLPVNGTATLTATVQGTSTQVSEGVGWYLSCQSGGSACGTLSSPSSASGQSITYTAPSSISSNTLVAEVVAFSEAQQTANNASPILITTFNSSVAAGNYVLYAQGADASLSPYQFAAVIHLDGMGGVVPIASGQPAGEQSENSAVNGSVSDTITGGTYFLGNDGRGTITLNDTTIGTETFAFVFLSSTQALISEMDGFASATGTMDLQTSTAAPTSGYAFEVSGTNVAKALPMAFGGVLNIDSPNTISGNGSVTDEILGNKINTTALGISGALTSPDQFGAVTITLSAPFGSGNKPTPVQFTGYIVDATHIKLVETDNTSGSGFGTTGGIAVGQESKTGTFTSNSSLSGTYVFGILGTDLSNSNLAPNTLTAAGLFTADGSGNLANGFTDTFLAVNTVQGSVSSPQTGAQISAPFTGTYSVDSTGTGRATSTAITFNPEPKDNYDPAFFFYLTGLTAEGQPAALILQTGDTHYPSVGTGVAYAQSGSPSFNGDYGLSFTQEQSGSGENDGTAPVTANSTTAPPSLSGTADINVDFGSNPDQPFTGTFVTPVATGPFSGTLVGTENLQVNSQAFNPPIAVDYYFIDPNHGFFVETDLVNAVSPEQTGQVSLGYYTARIPVCAGCP